MSVLTEEVKQRIREYTSRYPSKQAVTLPALHLVQDQLRCVPDEAVVEIANVLDLSPAEVHDTLSFYGFFRSPDHKLGRRRVWVCRSLSCALRGGEELLEAMCNDLEVSPGGTTEDGAVTIEYAECLGACEAAPCLLVDDERRENVSIEEARRLLGELRQSRSATT